MNTKSKSMKVSAALNHASYTFQSFTAADWRELAQECLYQADKRTCVDCGQDMSLNTGKPSGRPHKLAALYNGACKHEGTTHEEVVKLALWRHT